MARRRGREDRRVMKTRISAAGLARLQAFDRPVERFERRWLGGFGKPRRRALIGLLAVVQGCQARGSRPKTLALEVWAAPCLRGEPTPPAAAAEVSGRLQVARGPGPERFLSG